MIELSLYCFYVVKFIKRGSKMSAFLVSSAEIQAITGYNCNEIVNFTLGERIAAQKELEAKNYHTAVLIIDAITQGNAKVLDGLMVIEALHQELGEMTYEMQQFRKWLATLLVD